MEQKLIERLKNTNFVVVATSYEHQMLWEEYAIASELEYPSKKSLELDWQEEPSGCLVDIGMLDNRPLSVNLRWAKINNKSVLFVDYCSTLCDWKVLDEWLEKFCPYASYHTNAMDFPVAKIKA